MIKASVAVAILLAFVAIGMGKAIINYDRQLELLTRDVQSYNVETGVINYK